VKRSPLPRRPGVTVTELGFGGASVGNRYTAVSDDGAVAAIDTAWECGIRYFDTAPHYGLGLSEERLGEALATRPRTETVLSTKVGRLLVPAGLGPPRVTTASWSTPTSHESSTSALTPSFAR
jgi:D-threo-aldose 1-dehydrogenase